jgi:glyceraldehyde 3-phosphate dehydrogenase
MAIRLGVNGFGRVGRNFFRAVDAQHAAGTTDIEIVAVNDLTDNKTLAHLLKYDSVLGRLARDVSVDGEDIVVGDQVIKAWSIAGGPAALPWGDLGVDVVIESTGRYTAAEQARGHLHGGAKKVVVSATSKGADLTVVLGVNHRDYDGTQTVVSNASCTTNCPAPSRDGCAKTVARRDIGRRDIERRDGGADRGRRRVTVGVAERAASQC